MPVFWVLAAMRYSNNSAGGRRLCPLGYLCLLGCSCRKIVALSGFIQSRVEAHGWRVRRSR